MRTSSLLFLVFFFARTADAQSTHPVATADSLLNEAIMHHKTDQAAPFYEDAFVLTASSGARKNKQAMLVDIANPDLHWEINHTSEVQVQHVGSTAVLIGKLHQRGTYKGQPFDFWYLVTDTWVKQGGLWKLLAGHASRISAP